MDIKNLSKNEIFEILGIIHHSLVCKDEEEIRQLLERTKELVCADYSTCGLGRHDKKGLVEAVCIINGSYPEEWFSVYQQEGLYEIDPIVRYNYTHFETQLWADTYKKYKDTISKKFLSDASGFSLNFGIASGAKSPTLNMSSIISFSSRKNHFKNRHKLIMDYIAPHLHQALLRVNKESRRRNIPPMTDREKEVLRWMKEGKSNWEISMILKISENTVKFHVLNIESKLDAVNKIQAVAVAMDQELIA
jgi:DNA-binding CsgD family transcriptional regulator